MKPNRNVAAQANRLEFEVDTAVAFDSRVMLPERNRR